MSRSPEERTRQACGGRPPLPFDVARAHDLYLALFGQVAELVKDKHLLMVSSGPLTQLPFQVLVTEKPDAALAGADQYRHAAWLAKRHAISVLPAVSSLAALRRDARPSNAAKPYLGIGNPLLDGPDIRYAALARQARQNQSCPKARRQQVASFRNMQRGMRQISARDGLVDVANLRVQTPLPETADELCAVARDLKAGTEDVRLGPKASEADLKTLSEQGSASQLSRPAFATHGAVSGEISGGVEPGLVLNPPPETDRTGRWVPLGVRHCRAYELDADWVILSACNTAAGNAENAEALSGLARALFYAGGRSLFVSHWAVDLDATVKLITKAIATIANERGVGLPRRCALHAGLGRGRAQPHPAYWAPFVIVGEGAAAR